METVPFARAEALHPPLTPDSPLWTWAYAAILERAQQMLGHQEGVQAGEDIDAVHDMRVGSRRLTATMRVFGRSFTGADYRALYQEARSVTRQLGVVRDLDVLLDHYRRLQASAQREELLGIDYLLAIKEREWRRARRPLLAALERTAGTDFPGRLARCLRRSAEEYAVGLDPESQRRAEGHGFRAEILDCVEKGRLREPAEPPSAPQEPAPALTGHTPFREAATACLTERLAELDGFAPYASRSDCTTELHDMRVAAKWLRYTMELFAPAFAKSLNKPLARVKVLQELLGNLHDSDVRRDLLAQTLAAPLDVRGLEALHLLLPDPVEASLRSLQAREEEHRRGCYAAFHAEWIRLEEKSFRRKLHKRFQNPDASGDGTQMDTFLDGVHTGQESIGDPSGVEPDCHCEGA